MKQTISSLAKFADEVSQKKFMGLSTKKQHELLAALAHQYINKDSYQKFIQRYEELHEWAELDVFCPGSWLSEKEALQEFFRFHSTFSPNPFNENHKDVEKNVNLTWKPDFQVSIYLDNIRSPYNIGSIIRIADNFGLKEIVHSNPDLDLNHPRIKKSSRNASFWIPLRYEPDPINWLEKTDAETAALETGENAVNVSKWIPEKETIIIAGNEENGISEKILKAADKKIEIPMFGYKKSMNVSSAVSIAAHRYIQVHM